jgi:hypothetical protein
MKTQILRVISLVVMVSFTTLFVACDLLDEVDDIDFDATLEESIDVTEASTGTNVSYTETIILDATADPDIDEYKDKITGFTINKVSYQITSFDGTAGTTFTGTSTVSATITNLNLQTAYSSGQIFDLTISQADVDKVAALLKDDKAVKIYLAGVLSKTPLYCTVRIILEVSVKADAL